VIKIADHWFKRRRIDASITLLWEPHVDPLLRCNIWHIRGRDRDLLIDTGMGICSLRSAARDLFEKSVGAVATHAHMDHMGSMHEFDTRVVHSAEAEDMSQGSTRGSLRSTDWPAELVSMIVDAGYALSEELLTAYPRANFDASDFHTKAAAPTRLVEEGDIIDTGDRAFEVLHLPGHSPGSIGMWEAKTRTLFSGDAVYDGPLLDTLPGSDIDAYILTMQRLKSMNVSVVHAGHDPSFDGRHLVKLAQRYIEQAMQN